MVCILDTGVNSGHPLLINAFDDDSIQTVERAWGENDLSSFSLEKRDKLIFDYYVIKGSKIASILQNIISAGEYNSSDIKKNNNVIK